MDEEDELNKMSDSMMERFKERDTYRDKVEKFKKELDNICTRGAFISPICGASYLISKNDVLELVDKIFNSDDTKESETDKVGKDDADSEYLTCECGYLRIPKKDRHIAAIGDVLVCNHCHTIAKERN